MILDTPRPPPGRGGDPIMLDLDIPGSVAARTQRSPLQVSDAFFYTLCSIPNEIG